MSYDGERALSESLVQLIAALDNFRENWGSGLQALADDPAIDPSLRLRIVGARADIANLTVFSHVYAPQLLVRLPE